MTKHTLLFISLGCSPITPKVDFTQAYSGAIGDADLDTEEEEEEEEEEVIVDDDDDDSDDDDDADDDDDDDDSDDDDSDDDDDDDDDDVDDDDDGDDDDDDDDDDSDDDDSLPEWTFMVYLAGDNNLEEAALIDLNEMEQVGSTDDVNILVEIDRAEGYTTADGNWTGARRYRVEADSDTSRITSPVAVDLGEVDSGSPATFIDFVEWGATNYPAKNYAFVIWNHGWSWTMAPSGARKGIAEDEESGSDLTVAGGEYETILEASKDILGEKLALMGLDACLMASWEIARASSDYAEYFVASQATESIDGWAFHTALADLVADPEMGADELGTVIAQRFYETEDSTLSVIDLDNLADMDDALSLFADAVMSDENPRGEVRRQARQSQNFDGDPNDRDLGDFMLRMTEATDNPDILSAADGLLAELNDSIVANYTFGEWVSDATGLSIYLPVNGPSSLYLEGSWIPHTTWDEMLEAVDN